MGAFQNYTIDLPAVRYEYAKLRSNKDSIRLLMLCNGLCNPFTCLGYGKTGSKPCQHHTDDPYMLSGILFETTLAEVGDKYIALSYTWGDDTRKKAIKTDRGWLTISDNLNTALTRILLDEGPGILVWADALCINQVDLEEKERQIPLMSLIYGSAVMVYAHIGHEWEDDHLAIQLMLDFIDVYQERCTTQDMVLAGQKRLGLPDMDDRRWAAFSRLLRNPYFRRIWIVQEIVSAKRVLLIWGRYTCLEFKIFGLIWFVLSKLQIPRTGRIFPDTTDLFNSVITKALKGWLSISSILYLIGYPRRNLISLLDDFRNSKATIYVDIYFALAPMSTAADDLLSEPDLRIDYTEKSDSVAIRYTRYMLKTLPPGEAIQILSMAQPRSNKFGLPSWVPCWTEPLLSYSLTYLQKQPFADNVYKAGMAEPLDIRIGNGLDQHLLTISALYLEPLEFVGYNTWGGQSPQETMVNSIVSINELGHLIGAYPTGESVLDVLWQTFTLSKYSVKVGELPSAAFDYSDVNMAALTESLRFVRCWFDSVSKAMLSMPPVLPLMHDKAEFGMVQIWHDTKCLKFALLSNKLAAMVPITAEKGDVVVVVAGARVPYVLRPEPEASCSSNDQRFSLVGACYVHGIMQGQAINDETRRKIREFVLV